MPTTKRQAMLTLYLEWRVRPGESEDQAQDAALEAIRERINRVQGEWLKPVEGTESASEIVTASDGEWLFTEEGDLPDD